MARHPSTENILKWLEPSPAVLAQDDTVKSVAGMCSEVAKEMVYLIEQDSPELTAGLRKLLEAKDCLVRAALDEKPGFWTDR